MSAIHSSHSALIRTLSQALQEACPANGPSYQTVEQIVAKTLSSSPNELLLYTQLYNYHLGLGHNRERYRLNAIYNITAESFELMPFSFNGEKLLAQPAKAYSFADTQALKKLSKSLRKLSLATGQEIFWLKAEGKSEKAVQEYVATAVKAAPPHRHIAQFDISFSHENPPQSWMGGFGVKSNPLGVSLIAHTAPYLPMGISYFVGCTGNEEHSRIKARDISDKHYSTLDNCIKSAMPAGLREGQEQVDLAYLHLLTSPECHEHVIYELLHSALQYQFDEVKASFTFRTFGRREVTLPCQAMDDNTVIIASGTNVLEDYRQRNPDKFAELTPESRFGTSCFQVRRAFSTSQPVELAVKSTAGNLFEKAQEFSELLNKAVR